MLKVNDKVFFILLIIGCFCIESTHPSKQNLVNHSQPIILVTDLMRPYDDPDDHWDLATAYALAFTGAIDLKGIIVDSPENTAYLEQKSPDIAAIAMLNYLSGLGVPVTSGSPYPFKGKNDKQLYANGQDLGGVNLIKKVLLENEEGVRIITTGSNRDVAIALSRYPQLFSERCTGIYINAGLGLEDPYERGKPEWNVKLDMEAFHTIFQAPCPVYWFPINISHYRFKHGEVTPALSANMHTFFSFMYEKEPASKWYEHIQGQWQGTTGLEGLDNKYRSMFSTASFFHAAGFFGKQQTNAPFLGKDIAEVADIQPIKIESLINGYVQYKKVPEGSGVYMLDLKKTKEVYERVMGKALSGILAWLP